MAKMSSDCIFCDIVKGIASADFQHKDEDVVVFKDIYPHAPVHLLIVPREHIRSVNELSPKDSKLLAHMLFVGKNMAKEQGIAKTGYKLLYNVERGGGQVIFHLHLHLMGGWR